MPDSANFHATIRAVTAKDVPELSKIFDSLLESSRSSLAIENANSEQSLSASSQFAAHWSEVQIAEELRKGNGLALVHDERSSLAGIRAFVFFRRLPDATEITHLATSPRFQRRGYMRSLLRHFLSENGKLGPIWLEVHERNLPAQKLYLDFGFQCVGKRPRYYPGGGSALLYNYG